MKKFLLLLLFSCPAFATTWYVSPTGSDTNPCTAGSPCATPWYAVNNKALAGDTVQVTPGTYDGGASEIHLTTSGSAGLPITLTCTTRGACKIQNSVTGNSTVLWIQGSYVTLDGFEVTNTSAGNNLGVYISGSNVSVTRNVIHHIEADCTSAGGGGINVATGAGSGDVIDSNLVYDIGWGNPSCSGTNHVHGINFEPNAPATVTITNNIVYHTLGGWGIQFQGASVGSTGSLIANNLLFSNGNGGIVFAELGGTIDFNTVVNNTILSNGTDQPKCGIYEFAVSGTHNAYHTNDAYGNTGGDYCFSTGAQTGGISVNPSLGTTFVNWQADGSGNYQEKAGSPTIAVGTTTSVTHDYANTPRTAPFDIGPYQYLNAWYVSPVIGGPRYSANYSTAASCDGRGSGAFNPSGAPNQHCPYISGDLLWNDPYAYNDATWVIAGGDTVVVMNTVGGSHDAQFSGGTGNYGESCWGIGPYCSSPPVPSGTLAKPTTFVGENNGACEYTDSVGVIHGDPAKESWIWAGANGGVGQVFDVSTTQHVKFSCLHMTDHAACNRTTIACGTQPWAGKAITSGNIVPAVNDDVNLTDVTIEGFQSRGIIGNMGGKWRFYAVDLLANAQAGLDLDPGSREDSHNLDFEWHEGAVSFSGCTEQYPKVDTIPLVPGGCTDQNNGGYGDGIGTPPDSGILSFWLDHVEAEYNTQDAFDLGHVVAGTLKFTRNYAVGNMGGNLKGGEPNTYIAYNNFVNANCMRMAAALPGAPAGYNTGLTLWCRSGDQNTNDVDMALHPGTTDIEFNTLVGYGSTVYDVQCINGPCTSSPFTFSNNIVIGYIDPPYNAGQAPGMWNNFIPDTQTKNIFWGIRTCPAVSGDISPTCAVSPSMTGQPSSPIASEAALDNYNFHVSVFNAGTYNASVPVDFYGTSRPNPPTVGAAEYSSVDQTATPTITPNGGTFASSVAVTLADSTPSAIICWNTTGFPATNGLATACAAGSTLYSGAITVSTSSTVYAVAQAPGFTQSLGANAAFTITLPQTATPTCSPAAGTYLTTQTVTCSSVTPSSTTYCTINGSTPTTSSPVCTGISVASTLTLKAISAASGFTNSAILSQGYTISPPPGSLPTVTGTTTISGTVSIQ